MTDPTDAPQDGILTVCTANICRSPLAELHLREAFAGGAFGGVAVASAGVLGHPGAAMCDLSRRYLDDPEAAEAHVARSLTRETVERAALVLTMERDQRGSVARLAPGHQHKVFTLREADAMVAAIAADRDRPMPRSAPELADRMRGLRGIIRPAIAVPPPRPRLGVLRRRPPDRLDDGLSIADGHNVDAEEHARTAALVRELSGRIGLALHG